MTGLSTCWRDRRPKSAKARSRGWWGAGWQRVLWGFDAGAEVDRGRDAGKTPPGGLQAREMGRVLGAFQWAFGAYQRANGTLSAVIGSRESAAGVSPAHWDEQTTMLTGRPAHEVSILLGGVFESSALGLVRFGLLRRFGAAARGAMRSAACRRGRTESGRASKDCRSLHHLISGREGCPGPKFRMHAVRKPPRDGNPSTKTAVVSAQGWHGRHPARPARHQLRALR
jgi:hypothetical protein